MSLMNNSTSGQLTTKDYRLALSWVLRIPFSDRLSLSYLLRGQEKKEK